MIEKIEKQEWEKCQVFEKNWWEGHLNTIKSGTVKETPSEWTLFDNPFMHKYIMEIAKDKIVIDIGCGPNIQHIIGRIECRLGIGVDPLLDVYKKSGWPVPVSDKCIPIISKSENLPFMNGYADIIVTINALDHMNDARASIQEMVRVLKPGGHLFINTDMRTPEQRQEGHLICIDNEFINTAITTNKLQTIYQDVVHLERKGTLTTWVGIYKTA
jgi:SAM-dependent methyltransferase